MGYIHIWRQFFLLKNYESISMKFKIQVFYFYDKIKRSLWKRNKIKYSSMGHSQIWHHFFLVKIDQSILMIFKICITQFYHRTKCKQGTRAKSDNFPRETLKLDIIFHWSQNNNQNLSKKKKKWGQSWKLKQNQMFFHRTYPNLRLQKN